MCRRRHPRQPRDLGWSFEVSLARIEPRLSDRHPDPGLAHPRAGGSHSSRGPRTRGAMRRASSSSTSPQHPARLGPTWRRGTRRRVRRFCTPRRAGCSLVWAHQARQPRRGSSRPANSALRNETAVTVPGIVHRPALPQRLLHHRAGSRPAPSRSLRSLHPRRPRGQSGTERAEGTDDALPRRLRRADRSSAPGHRRHPRPRESSTGRRDQSTFSAHTIDVDASTATTRNCPLAQLRAGVLSRPTAPAHSRRLGIPTLREIRHRSFREAE